MRNNIKVRCENCGNEWEINIEDGWTIHQMPYVGIAFYPPEDGDQSRGSKVLRCRVCNKCRQIIII